MFIIYAEKNPTD